MYFSEATKLALCGVLSALILSACTSRFAPAPVSNIGTYSEAVQRNQDKIKSAKYTVKKGETLYSIAWRANSQVSVIANLNNIEAPYKIYPGQTLFLVHSGSKKTLEASKDKVLNKKLTKNSTLKPINSSKNTLASTKKQAYGDSKSTKKQAKNKAKPPTNTLKKVSQWQWPVNGEVIEFFSSKQQGNKGIDITGRKGTKIKAAAGGKIVYAGSALRGYGKLIIVKHNDDFLSAYAHNDKILVKEQQWVNRGDYIAKMGDTGANRVMLHFEIRFRGKSVNPLKYLPKK